MIDYVVREDFRNLLNESVSLGGVGGAIPFSSRQDAIVEALTKVKLSKAKSQEVVLCRDWAAVVSKFVTEIKSNGANDNLDAIAGSDTVSSLVPVEDPRFPPIRFATLWVVGFRI